MSLILLMLDGLGLAPAGPTNPLATTPLPALAALLGGPLTLDSIQHHPGLLLQPIDATLGVPGLPQSGTGHTAILAGVNAPRLVGRHQPAFPPTALRGLLAERSIFRRARDAGYQVAFANAYSPGYWQALAARRTRRAASTIAAEAAGLGLRTLDDLRAGRALYWDVDGSALARWYADAPPPTPPHAAGAVLTALARDASLVYYECFLPDLVAHGRVDLTLDQALQRIDGLIGGLLASRDPADTLIITSDHGNCEDSSSAGHTRNPVPLLAVGPAAMHFAAVADIAAIAGTLIAALEG